MFIFAKTQRYMQVILRSIFIYVPTKNFWHRHKWQCACLRRTATCECQKNVMTFFSQAKVSTHFAWSSNAAVNSSLCTLVQCTQTNLRVTYSRQICRWSERTLILTNDSPCNITRLIRVSQSHTLHFCSYSSNSQGRTEYLGQSQVWRQHTA
jgi:hypothetical protein